ncbi:MAG: hypothetical protein JWM11_7214 [Planctomycetaceae bacterium]|nr:hypothetical protein [Planctomycetaceae bacterium]
MYKFVQTSDVSRSRPGRRRHRLHITERCRWQFLANWVQNSTLSANPPPLGLPRCVHGLCTTLVPESSILQVVQRPLNHPGERGGGRVANRLQNSRQLDTHSRQSGPDYSPIGYTFSPIGYGLLANWVQNSTFSSDPPPPGLSRWVHGLCTTLVPGSSITSSAKAVEPPRRAGWREISESSPEFSPIVAGN